MAETNMKKVEIESASAEDFNLTTKDGKAIDVPHEGSMGLLGLGHVGLFAWRAKRKELGVFPFDADTKEKLVKAQEERIAKKQAAAEE